MKSIILTVLLGFYALTVNAEILEDIKEINAITKSMFEKKQFSELSKLGEKYLVTEERTSTGIWKLKIFYVGLLELWVSPNRDEEFWSDLENKTLSWIKSQPESPVGYLAHANVLSAHAWAYRGNELGYKVKVEDWKIFKEYIARKKRF